MAIRSISPTFLLFVLTFMALGVLPWQSLSAQDEVSKSIRIPCLLGLTGDSSTFGSGELHGIQLATEEWNHRGGIQGKRIFLDVQDTGTDGNKVLSAYKWLTEIQGHKVILGPTWLDTFQAVLPLAERGNVLLITPSADGRALMHSDPENIAAFTTYYSSQVEVQELLRAAKERGITSLVGAFTEEPFFQMVRGLVEANAASQQVEYKGSHNFPPNESDFNSFLIGLKKTAPQAVLMFLMGEQSVTSFLKARRRYFPDLMVIGSHDFEGWMQQSELRALSTKIIYPAFEQAEPSFNEKFQRRFGVPATLTHSNAYDAANMLFGAMERGHSTPDALRSYLLSTEFDTVTFGRVRFTKNGMIDSGKVRIVSIP